MRINIEEIGERGLDHQEHLGRAWLDDALSGDRLFSAAGPVELSARLEKIDDGLIVRASLAPSLTTQCRRCLKGVQLSLPVSFTLSLVPEGKAANRVGPAEDGEGARGTFVPAEVDQETFKGRTVDLEPMVREQILLALPMDVLCDEGCKGLCPTCGQDLNERSCGCEAKALDPRWEKLRAVKLSN